MVGAPHPVLGEDVVAFVVLHDGQGLTARSCGHYALEQLADYKVPRQWHFVDELPRNATGKVVKPELRRLRLADAPSLSASISTTQGEERRWTRLHDLTLGDVLREHRRSRPAADGGGLR